MESFKRGVDGRRRFSSEFRKSIVIRVGRKEQSVAEIGREIESRHRSSTVG
jgi:transposase-like protein